MVTVIGITDHSFSQPDILLSASVPSDAGYFGERLTAARSQLVRVWKARSAILAPHYRYTDIIGAVMLTGQLFDQQTERKIFVIYSDMRHHTKDLDLETPRTIPRFEEIAKKCDCGQVSLQDVEVHVLGADGAGKSLAYWESLRQFWIEFFHLKGALG